MNKITINQASKHPQEYYFECVKWEIEHHVITIKLSRPDKKNAINAAMAREIVYLLAFAKSDDSIRVVKIKSCGDVFSAGGDLAAMRGDKQETRSTVPSLASEPNSPNADLNLIALALQSLHKPSVVKVEGSVFAGALLIICNANYVFATRESQFSAPEIHRGLWPYMVMAGLFRIVPRRKGQDWILSGETIKAEEAEDWGLINQACDSDEIESLVDSKIKQLAQLPPNTVKLGLEAFQHQDDLGFEAALEYLSGMLIKTLQEGDAEEGIKAFIEKRKPVWKV